MLFQVIIRSLLYVFLFGASERSMAIVDDVGAEEVGGVEVGVFDKVEHHLCEDLRRKRTAMLEYRRPYLVR